MPSYGSDDDAVILGQSRKMEWIWMRTFENGRNIELCTWEGCPAMNRDKSLPFWYNVYQTGKIGIDVLQKIKWGTEVQWSSTCRMNGFDGTWILTAAYTLSRVIVVIGIFYFWFYIMYVLDCCTAVGVHGVAGVMRHIVQRLSQGTVNNECRLWHEARILGYGRDHRTLTDSCLLARHEFKWTILKFRFCMSVNNFVDIHRPMMHYKCSLLRLSYFQWLFLFFIFIPFVNTTWFVVWFVAVEGRCMLMDCFTAVDVAWSVRCVIVLLRTRWRTSTLTSSS